MAALAPYLHIYNINKPIEIEILREIREAGREMRLLCAKGEGSTTGEARQRGKMLTSIDAKRRQSVNDEDDEDKDEDEDEDEDDDDDKKKKKRKKKIRKKKMIIVNPPQLSRRVG